MPRARVFAAAALASAIGAPAVAIDFTYLEAGLLWEDPDESLDLSIADIDTDGGVGVRLAGGLDLVFGVFIDGELAWTSPEAAALVLSGDESDSGATDAEALRARLSAGYKFELFDIAAIYGQVGYVQRTLEFDDLSLTAPGNTLSLLDLDADQGGYEAEIGARAEVLPRIELTGAVRVSDVGALTIAPPGEVSIPEFTTVSELEFDDGVFGEAGVIFQIFGPVALRGTYEFGDANAAFLGLRAQF
ncbi:MAG: porin family protein [Caulobacterales bacterium]|nr:porin family protein [Caulobacterales bacterium]